MRLDTTKTDHFLEFISSSALLHDVSYGTKSLKLYSGETLLVPAAIRTLIPSRIVRQYQSYCESVEFEPYSERTLFRLLEACSVSKQASLQGLDYIATEGAEAFEKLKSVVSLLEENGVDFSWANTVAQDSKAGKRYLKTDYKTGPMLIAVFIGPMLIAVFITEMVILHKYVYLLLLLLLRPT